MLVRGWGSNLPLLFVHASSFPGADVRRVSLTCDEGRSPNYSPVVHDHRRGDVLADRNVSRVYLRPVLLSGEKQRRSLLSLDGKRKETGCILLVDKGYFPTKTFKHFFSHL